MDRRQFLAALAVTGVAGALPLLGRTEDSYPWRPEPVPATTGGPGRVVVVGGGMGGATVAKYLRIWGGADVKVTLVESAPVYNSCILSNLVLTGQLAMSQLQFNWNALRTYYGVQVVPGEATEIDPVRGVLTVATASGTVPLGYDHLVLSPGIEFDYSELPGLQSPESQLAVPHAWKAGDQTTVLRNQLLALPAGGTVIMSIPKAPFRCPPGPYERACVIADWLKRNRPGSRLLVLDANTQIVAERETFERAFLGLHGSVIDYRASHVVKDVDAATRTVYYVDATDPLQRVQSLRGDVVNVIPPHRAGRLVTSQGLANGLGGRWAAVDVLSYESTVPGAGGIHVIGDASSTTQPKAGHIANQEAKVCADAITRTLRGQPVDPAPMTNSACYSPITAQEASWLTAVFAYDPLSRSMKIVGGAASEASSWTTDNHAEMFDWFRNLMIDSFS